MSGRVLHGGSPKGAEFIAARWADHRKVPQIAFKTDWIKHAKAAPFKRNDQMLDVLPIGVIIFPGTGNQENLAGKARKLGIPSGNSATAARECRLFCVAYNVRIKLDRAVVTVAFSDRKGLPPLPLAKQGGNRVAGRTSLLQSPSHRSSRLSVETMKQRGDRTCREKMKTRPS
jgi:hypothetical protein